MVAPIWALNTIKNLCSPKKVGQSSPTFFLVGCYPIRPPIMPNLIEIGQTSLEKSVKKRYLFGPSRHFLSRTTFSLESKMHKNRKRNAHQLCHFCQAFSRLVVQAVIFTLYMFIILQMTLTNEYKLDKAGVRTSCCSRRSAAW